MRSYIDTVDSAPASLRRAVSGATALSGLAQRGRGDSGEEVLIGDVESEAVRGGDREGAIMNDDPSEYESVRGSIGGAAAPDEKMFGSVTTESKPATVRECGAHMRMNMHLRARTNKAHSHAHTHT